MRNFLTATVLLCYISTHAFASTNLVSAKDAQTVTKKATKEYIKSVLSSKTGKKAYDDLINFFNKHIATIASEGFYNTFTITYLNSKLKVEIKNILSGLSHKEQDLMRDLIIKELIRKGYKISYNKFWDNPESFNISVQW